MISVGIVVYNGAEHIRKSLESVINQPYKNIELIVVDGSSSDGTRDILNEYSQHISRLVSEPDRGIYDAMNKVCLLASGDWLIFLGCDDQLKFTFSDMAESLIRPEAVYYGNVILRSSGKISGGKFTAFRLVSRNICHQAIFYPRTVYKKYSYSLEYPWLADYAYNIRLFGDGIAFIFLNQLVSIYNDKGGSSLGDADFEKDKLKMIYQSLGAGYALIAIPIRIIDKIIIAAGSLLKRLLPYSFWKALQELWRSFRNLY